MTLEKDPFFKARKEQKMTIFRAWKSPSGQLEEAKEITEDRAKRELLNAHGDGALDKLGKEKKLSTRFAEYTIQ